MQFLYNDIFYYGIKAIQAYLCGKKELPSLLKMSYSHDAWLLRDLLNQE